MKILLVFILALLCGCTPVIKLISGFHDPKPEDRQSLTEYLSRKKISADNVLVFADSSSYYQRLYEMKDFPDIRVFDRSGKRIYYKDTTISCTGSAYDFTKAICTFKNLKSSASKSLSAEAANLKTIDDAPVFIPENDEADYYVLIYWARFLGRLNKNHVRAWENNLKHAKSCRVRVYKVNMDWQKAWNKE